ncbi:MAG: NYN domain-containing protein, partial [Candidatus Heimdallarchaeota archaeon]|nr:NYN domain-containing protein [Candidatus Heimdallarchaeota archaeon]
MSASNESETDVRSLEQLTKNQKGLNENISNIVKKVAHLEERRNDLAILWDVQNINPGTKSPFVEGLIEYVSEYGKLVIAKAFGDWSQDNIKKLAIPLSQNGFEMIHIPDIVKRKNASDMEMITNGIEIIMQHPNIDHYFIIASDIDFRPFVNALRRNGKLTT